jgi:hypothetical protein
LYKHNFLTPFQGFCGTRFDLKGTIQGAEMANEVWGDSPDGATTEEVILSKLDATLGFPLAVKLITYPDGTMDLFRQAGDNFDEHIAQASAVLEARGMVVGVVEVVLKTGAYLPVRQKIAEQPDALAPVRENPLTLAMTPFKGHAALVNLVFTEKLGQLIRQDGQAVKHR